jgi:transposase-like protein
MRTPFDQVASAIGMYYEGRSLNDIPRIMYQQRGSVVTSASVYKWVKRFSKIAVGEADKTKVNVGDTWLADEKAVKIGGKSYWLIDIIDADTRFLLATKLSHGRSIDDIKHVMEAARDKAGMVPKQVLTDGWKGYLDGIELAYGADVKHVRTIPFDNEIDSTRLAEYWHETLKDRSKLMCRLKNRDHAQLILDGWLVHYNYFRLQEALNGKTPAEVAKANFKYHSWLDLVYQSKSEASNVKVQEPLTMVNIPKIRIPSIVRLVKGTSIANIANISDITSRPLLVSVQPGSNEVILSRGPGAKSNRVIKIFGKSLS